MNSSNYKLSLDVQQACSPVVLEGKLGDTRRTLWISLTDGGVPYTIAGECYAVFTAAKPDGTFIANPCRILGNTVVYALTPQTLAAVGYCDCEIRLYGADDGLLTSARFGLLVHEPALGDEDVIQSETEVNALTQLIGDAAQVIRESELQNLESRVLIGELELHRQDFEQKAADARADAKAAELSAQVAEGSAREVELARTAAELARQEAQLHRAAAEDANTSAKSAMRLAAEHRTAAEDAAAEAKTSAEQAKKHAQEAAQHAGSGGGINLDALDQRIEEAIREHSEIDDQCHPDIRKHLDALDQRFSDVEQDVGDMVTGKLNARDLPEAIEDALAQAKTSGEFDGPPGPQGPQGPTGLDGMDGARGPKGDKGDPGEDYVLTDADKTEIARMTAELVDCPTDDHINGLIDTKLGVIENGTY